MLLSIQSIALLCEPLKFLHLFNQDSLKIALVWPRWLCFPANKVAYLEGDLGVPRPQLKRMIVAQPSLLSHSAESNLRPKVTLVVEPAPCTVAL